MATHPREHALAERGRPHAQRMRAVGLLVVVEALIAIEETVDARVHAGVHFRTADEQGARIGKQVARWRERHYFHPLRRTTEIAP